MSGFAGLRLAVGMLTVVPVRPPEQIGRRQVRDAMLLAPVAVLPVALAASLLGWGAVVLGLPPALAGVLVLAALVWGTRAMHIDGLADTTDALGSGKDAEGALAIMKRGDIGPMGTVALILVLAVEALATGVLLERPWGWALVATAVCVARGALVLGCAVGVPSARPSGLGAMFAGSVPVPAAVVVWLLVLGALKVAAYAAGAAWWLPLVAFALAAAACFGLLWRCVRRLGGITGDVLGALVELSAAVLLLVLAIPS